MTRANGTSMPPTQIGVLICWKGWENQALLTCTCVLVHSSSKMRDWKQRKSNSAKCSEDSARKNWKTPSYATSFPKVRPKDHPWKRLLTPPKHLQTPTQVATVTVQS